MLHILRWIFICHAVLVVHVAFAQQVTVRPFVEIVESVQYQVSAEVISDQISEISAQVPGIVERLLVKVGSKVKKGSTLVVLDKEDYRLKLANAQANLKMIEAKKELAEFQRLRAKELAEQAVASQEMYVRSETELNITNAELEAHHVLIDMAKRDLSKVTIKSPFSGVVTQRNVQLGEYVNLGVPLLTITDVKDTEVIAKIQTNHVASFIHAKQYMVEVDGHRFPVDLRTLLPIVDRSERTQEARLIFTKQAVPPGRLVTLTWQDSQPKIPATYLLRRDNQLGVFVAESGIAKFITLPDALEGRPAMVAFSIDKLIIEEGRHILQPGDVIEF